MKKIIIFLILAMILIIPVHGDIISDIFRWITGSGSNNETSELDTGSLNTTPSQWQNGNIVSCEESDEIYTVNYSTAKKGAVLNLYCRDTAGYYVPTWGASIVKSEGTFPLQKADRLGVVKNDCFFRIESGDAMI